MKFVLTIDSDNAAMQDGTDVARALTSVARIVDDMDGNEGELNITRPIKDLNGNHVGSWTLEVESTLEEEEDD